MRIALEAAAGRDMRNRRYTKRPYAVRAIFVYKLNRSGVNFMPAHFRWATHYIDPFSFLALEMDLVSVDPFATKKKQKHKHLRQQGSDS